MNEEKSVLEIVNEKHRELKKQRRKKTLFSYIRIIAIVAVITLLLNLFVFERAVVDGDSMSPTLNNGESVFEYKLGAKSKLPNREDIITFYIRDDLIYIKRVIGLPGDVIDIVDGNVYINDKLLVEDYLQPSFRGKTSKMILGKGAALDYPYTVPQNYVFVMGDNREVSIDSRSLGPISLDKIRGKALIKMFPFKKIE